MVVCGLAGGREEGAELSVDCINKQCCVCGYAWNEMQWKKIGTGVDEF